MQMNHKNSITQLLKWGYTTLKEHNISNSLMEARWLLSFILKIDFGDEIGIKKSSAQLTKNYKSDELINKMKEISKSKGWNLVRWITRDDNVRAKSLYDRVAKKTNWEVYELR